MADSYTVRWLLQYYTAQVAHSFVAKPSVGLTDGHFPRYHQWLFGGRGEGEVLLNSGALKVLLAEEQSS